MQTTLRQKNFKAQLYMYFYVKGLPSTPLVIRHENALQADLCFSADEKHFENGTF